MKVFIFVNNSMSIFMYWLALLKALQSRGHQVVCYVPKNAPKQDVERMASIGAKVDFYPLHGKGQNAFYDMYTLLSLCKILWQQKPEVIFASTIKPVVYTGLAKRLLAKYLPNTQVFACITGLGFAFEDTDKAYKKIIQTIAQKLYKISLVGVKKVFFQNSADIQIFRQKKLVDEEKAILYKGGTGVDTAHYGYVAAYPYATRFLLMARLLESKGIRDYVAAAKIVRQKYPEVTFALLGPEEKGMGAIEVQEVLRWQGEGIIEYLGAVEDVRPYIAGASVMVLPSWREGIPCAILEGMSMGRACIVSQVPGCVDVVQHKENGLIVPKGHVPELVKAMEYYILHPEEKARMGSKAREHVQKNFEAQQVASCLVRQMEL